MIQDEQWKEIVGWPEYEVSTLGKIKRIKTACGATKNGILNPWTSKYGYLLVGLSRNSKVKTILVHRVVAMTFIGDPTGLDVCHYDGDKTNNQLNNLRIDTRKGNMSDTIRMGKTSRGEKHKNNKHSEELIKQAKKEMKEGGVVRQIAFKYNIPAPTLYAISKGVIWGWL